MSTNEPPKAKISQVDRIVEEIISTEQSYVDSLRNLQKNFIEPLRAKENRKILKNADAKRLLELSKKLESILETSKILLEDLKKAREEPEPHFAVSKVFSAYISRMRLYSEYAASYSEITEILGKLKNNKGYQELYAGLQTAPGFKDSDYENPGSKGQEVSAHYIMPVQRIPRYKLLLETIKKEIPKEVGEKFGGKIRTENPEGMRILDTALNAIKDVGTDVNERTRQVEFFKKLGSSNSQDVTNAKSVTVSSKPVEFDFSDVRKNIAGVGRTLNQDNSFSKGSDVTKFSYSKPFLGRFMDRFDTLAIRADLADKGTKKGRSYTFLINEGENGSDPNKKTSFHVTIKEDISNLSPEEIDNLFNIAERIGKTVAKAAKVDTKSIKLNIEKPYNLDVSVFDTLEKFGCTEHEMNLMSNMANDGHFREALSAYYKDKSESSESMLNRAIAELRVLKNLGHTNDKIREVDQMPNDTDIRRSLSDYMESLSRYKSVEMYKERSRDGGKQFKQAEIQLNKAKERLKGAIEGDKRSVDSLKEQTRDVTPSAQSSAHLASVQQTKSISAPPAMLVNYSMKTTELNKGSISQAMRNDGTLPLSEKEEKRLRELGCTEDSIKLIGEMAHDGRFRKALSGNQQTLLKTAVNELGILQTFKCSDDQIKNIDRMKDGEEPRKSLLEYRIKLLDRNDKMSGVKTLNDPAVQKLRGAEKQLAEAGRKLADALDKHQLTVDEHQQSGKEKP